MKEKSTLFNFEQVEIQKMKSAFWGTLIFSLAANAFAYFNFYPQHDSINHAFNFAGSWEVRLGRFMLPIYGGLRGSATIPWVIGMLSIIYIALSVYFISSILKIEHSTFIFLCAGFLSANLSITEILAVYTYNTDAFMLSLLFSCLGVYIVVKMPKIVGIICAGLCFVLSIGMYQTYIGIAILLFIAVVCREVLSDKTITIDHFKKWGIYVLSLLFGIVGYFICYKLSFKLWNVKPVENNSRSVENLFSMDIGELLPFVKKTYLNFFEFFYGKDNILGEGARYANIALTLLAVLCLIYYLRKNKLSIVGYLILLIGVVIYPAVSLVTMILMQSKTIGFCESFPLFFFYLLLYKVIGAVLTKIKKQQAAKIFMYVCGFVILSQNIIYSNSAYVTQKVLYDRAMSYMSNILYDIEGCPEFNKGETTVLVVGSLPERNVMSKYSELSAFRNSSITYVQTFGSFAKILMGKNINVEKDTGICREYSKMEEVINMPSYPSDGYYGMVGDYLVVKLSQK